MANEVKRGNRHSTTFSRSSWAVIEREFYEKTNRRYNHSQFRNKYNQLRIYYQWFTKLLEQPGFVWDPKVGNAIADDDVWEAYLKTNKKARRFRKKGCPMYNELVIIFGETMIDYKDAYPLAQYPPSDQKTDQENESTNETPQAFPPDYQSTDKDSQNFGTRKRVSETPTHQQHHLHKNKEAKVAGTDGESLEAIKLFSNKQGSDPISDRTTQMFKNPEGCIESSSFSITNCVKCLESIPDVDAVTYVKALKMFKDVDWREMFMAMSAQRRSDWLASLE
ncbi:putative Myb/SANT-like domain-containing protein [Helianthus annuus]|uniref:Myb/SANT-like domain-containing protein n=2 Tax=Helianthus annuus TaxID=4232 RepID=A0A251SRL2_HELAN|nr:putative Myb/SANT-like domain-containing protein [Helianthus annuus]KAJ0497119.1 putative Myb/SANT-like domain-containing protein [Helianthus annuus]